MKIARLLTLVLLAVSFALQGLALCEELELPKIIDYIGSGEAPVVASPSAPSQPAVKEKLVRAIDFSGLRKVEKNFVLGVVYSKVGDPYLKEKVDADVKAIYGLGFFSDASASTAPYQEGVRITFTVVENPVVSAISFEGVTVFSSEALAATMETKAGEILNFVKLRYDMDRINELYQRNGYILARVVDVNTDPKTGVLTIKVIEGKIESIKIEGNESTQDYVITRELKTKPGTVLNEKLLSKDLRRVFNLGFFSEVNPSFSPGSSPDEVQLVINIKEQRTNTINLGGGYGEREGWFGFADLSINNLFGTGQALMIRGQSGQQFQTYQFKYMNPWVLEDYLGDHTSFTFRRWYTIGSDFYYTGQNEVHNGGDIAFGKPFLDVWSASWSLGSEGVFPYGDSTFRPYNSFTTGLSLSYDTRDFWMNPTEGVYHTASTKWGWKYTSDITQFMKYGLDLNFFHPLAERQVLALHESTNLAVGDVPVGELYYVGGANTVRGYFPSEQRIGTKRLLANIEYRYTFNEMFQGVIFYDYGDAWYSGAPDFAHFLSGMGFGVRMNTPMGPIRLDYGVGAGKSFGEGIVHFSIGQAF